MFILSSLILNVVISLGKYINAVVSRIVIGTLDLKQFLPKFKYFCWRQQGLDPLPPLSATVNFVPFLPIFGISLRLKREVKKFLYSYFTVVFSNVRWSYKPSFKKFLGANFELNDLIVNFVPFLPIFGISLRLKREVQKFSYSYFTVVFSSVR